MQPVSTNGTTLQVHDSGIGLPIVFAHGFPLSHSMWRHQFGELAECGRVVAPDLRGFGGSDVTIGTVTMEQFADDIASLLDVLQITEPVVFCGLSMGGYIGWQFALRHRDRLRALIQCDTRAIADSPEAVANRHRLADMVVETGSEAVAATMLPNLFAPETQRDHPEVIAETRQVVAATSPHGIAAAARGMAVRPDVTAELHRIDVPVLLIVGEHDRISTVDEMRSIEQRLPDATLQVIPHAGHMAPLEQQEAVNAAIRRFLPRVQGVSCG